MAEGTSDLSPSQLFTLGVARADQDLEEQLAAVRISESAGRIDAREAADKRLMILVNHREEIARLRAKYLL